MRFVNICPMHTYLDGLDEKNFFDFFLSFAPNLGGSGQWYHPQEMM